MVVVKRLRPRKKSGSVVVIDVVDVVDVVVVVVVVRTLAAVVDTDSMMANAVNTCICPAGIVCMNVVLSLLQRVSFMLTSKN